MCVPGVWSLSIGHLRCLCCTLALLPWCTTLLGICFRTVCLVLWILLLYPLTFANLVSPPLRTLGRPTFPCSRDWPASGHGPCSGSLAGGLSGLVRCVPTHLLYSSPHDLLSAHDPNSSPFSHPLTYSNFWVFLIGKIFAAHVGWEFEDPSEVN